MRQIFTLNNSHEIYKHHRDTIAYLPALGIQ